MDFNDNVKYDWDDDEMYRTPEQRQKEKEYLEEDIDNLCNGCSGGNGCIVLIAIAFLLFNALINVNFS